MKCVLVTGPVDRAAEYADAARRAGWDAIEFPLLRVRARELACSAVELAACELDCVTSSNALPALARARELAPGARPFVVVGAATRDRARELGFAPVAVAADAHDLANRVLALAPRPKRVFWPRGDQSDEFARALRANGVQVLDPIVYATERVAHQAPPPPADVVFFASPSAVRAWCELSGATRHSARVAIAIGGTTHDALRGATGAAFSAILSLPEPGSRAFERELAHLTTPP
ncbi:MAG: uroporphyrinogen-III synthase [Planctomycetes bacterium]|nr:uroporphyrinogen-III synthase [Planctomycetota bacterium]